MREDRFDGKVVIVTGSASGIGEATAKGFANEGAKVIISDIQTDKGELVVDDIKASGGDATFVHADVSKIEDCINLIEKAVDTYGTVDVLVNNAGILRPAMPIEEIPLEDWEDVMTTNFMSVVHCVQKVIPIMKEKGKGRIINMSSLASLRGATTVSPCYGVSKAAINSFTRFVANWVGAYNITINSIAPGFIATEMTKGGPLDADAVPLGKRYGEAEDIANAVMFLASEDAKYITGTLIDVNGGVFMR